MAVCSTVRRMVMDTKQPYLIRDPIEPLKGDDVRSLNGNNNIFTV